MEAAGPDRIGVLVDRLGDLLASGTLHAAPTAGLLVAKMGSSRLGLDDLHRLSAAFLDDRRTSMRGVLGHHAYAMQDVDFVFFPIVESCASTFIDGDRTTIFLSLGLVEALRLAIASAQLESAIARLESDQILRDALTSRGAGDSFERLRTMTQYFNASAVLHFKTPDKLPSASSLLDPATRHRVDIVLEAVLLFLLLHELGHVDFHRARASNAQTPHLVWEFAVPEEVDDAKAEEFYADAYAIGVVPEAFALPLVHAATFFLHLHNYVDATAGLAPSTHPLCVNRIATLYASAAARSRPDDVGHKAVAKAIAAGGDVWTQPKEHFSVTALQRYVEGLSRVDWGPAQEALQMLASDAHVGSNAVS